MDLVKPKRVIQIDFRKMNRPSYNIIPNFL